MKITAVKTHKITSADQSIFAILEKYLNDLPDRSILVITSKIVSICEGRLESIEGKTKMDLIKREADYYLLPEENKYHTSLTIKKGVMAAAAGIDESNGNGVYVLWPKDPQRSANKIREFIITKYKKKNIGVIITDSRSTPLRLGTVGIALAHSGFAALNDYVGSQDIFGRELLITKSNVLDGLSAGAVTVMGEGKEQTPLAIIEDIPFVTFQNRNPSLNELADLNVPLEDDLYAPILSKANWKKGNGHR